MSATLQTSPTGTSATKGLWAAVGVLSVAVLAMGATLIYIQTPPGELHLAVLPATEPTAAANLPAGPASASAPAMSVQSVKTEVSKKPAGSANHSPVAARSVAQTAHATTSSSQTPVAAPTSSDTSVAGHQTMASVPKAICGNCGTIESVTPIQRDGAGSGVGVVAGGVLGAVVGNQVGGGTGKTLATILGAVGGGVAGNAVEKKMKKETVFQVQVHMEDGSTRTLEQATAPTVGAKVIVEGTSLQPASR